MTEPRQIHEDEIKGLHRISSGATLGLAAGVAGLVIPLLVIFLTTDRVGAIFPVRPELIRAATILAIVGAILFFVSLLFYRRGFWVLRRAERWFWVPSVLCLVGTLGFLLLIVAALLAAGSSDALVQCLQGRPTHALSCLRTASPFAADSGIVGYWLAWLGGLGIVVGLVLSGREYRQSALYAGAGLYAILLLILVPSFLAVVLQEGELTYPLLLGPLLVLLAPGVVLDGARRARVRR